MKLYKIPIQKIGLATSFPSRIEKAQLSYRYYPAWSTHTIFLFHGLVSSSVYMSVLAHRIAERKLAQVIALDWRGHGDDRRPLEWKKDSDVLQDFEEVLVHVKGKTAAQRISLLGHSFGAKWMMQILKQAPPSLKFDHCFLTAPFLSESQLKPGWIEKTENEYRVSWPEGPRTGKERFQYPTSFLEKFNLSVEETQSLMQQSRFHTIEAGQDEILKPFADFALEDHRIFENATHMGLVMEPEYVDGICDLIEKNVM